MFSSLYDFIVKGGGRGGNRGKGWSGLHIDNIAQITGLMPLHLSLITTRYPTPNAPTNRSPFGALGLPPRSLCVFHTHAWKLRRFRAIKQIQQHSRTLLPPIAIRTNALPRHAPNAHREPLV